MKRNLRRPLWVVVTGAVFLAGLAAAFAGTAPADSGSPATGHIGICHHTGNSQAHEWIYIEPDASGVFDGHGQLLHQFEEDIIPAFEFTDAHGDVHTFAGLNLTTTYDASLEPVVAGDFTGAVILANRCVIPPSMSTTTVTVPETTTLTVPVTTTVHDTTTETVPVTTTVTVPETTTTVHDTTTVETPGPTTTVTAPAPAAPASGVAGAVAATTTVTVPGPTTTVAGPTRTVTRVVHTKPKVVTRWKTKLKVVRVTQCFKAARTP